MAGGLTAASGHRRNGTWPKIAQAQERFQQLGAFGFQSWKIIRHKRGSPLLYVYIRSESCHKKRKLARCHFHVAHPISPHRLRHTWASDMLRRGMSLPALMPLMGHKDIRMTLRYLKVTQPDLQREFYKARQNLIQSYRLPALSVSTATADLPGIHQALAATRHLLEMYRRQLSDDKTRHRLQRLDRRLLDIAQQLQNITAGGK
ncbi:MAG TPA: site-specific integrase [Terriglobia bacterium]